MTQPSLLDLPVTPTLNELLSKQTVLSRLAKLFLDRRGVWIDGREIAKVAGAYAWRTRVSDLRHAPWTLDIRNRQRRVDGADGETYVISEYALHV
jgi:hypothetical protein